MGFRQLVCLTLLCVGLSVVIPAQGQAGAAAACPQVQFVGVRGSGEKKTDAGGFGPTVDAVRRAVVNSLPKASSHPVDYTAFPVKPGLKYGDNYRLSVAEGKAVLKSFLTNFHNRCAGRALVLSGYSQGAHVVLDALQELAGKPVAGQVKAVVVFGDPRFNPSQRSISMGSFDPALRGIWGSWPNPGGKVRTLADSLTPKVRSYCLKYDPFCNFSSANLANCSLPMLYCVHTRYTSFGYPAEAAKWVLSRLNLPSRFALLNTTLGNAVAGSAYHARLQASGGRLPYRWAANGTALSAGLTFNPRTQVLAGTPRKQGTFTLTVTVKDAANGSVTRSYQLRVVAPPKSPTGGPNAWPQQGHDGGQSGYNGGERAISAATSLARKWTLPDTGFTQIGQPLVAGTTLYRIGHNHAGGGFRNMIEARSAADGRLRWSLPLEFGGDLLPLVGVTADRLLFIDPGLNGGTLTAVRLSDRRVMWRYGRTLGRPLEFDGATVFMADPTIESGGRTFTPITAVSVVNGAILWTRNLEGLVQSTGAHGARSGVLVMTTTVRDTNGIDHHFTQGWAQATGKRLWRLPTEEDTPGGVGHGPCAIALTTLFCLRQSTSMVETRDLDSGALKWRAGYYAKNPPDGISEAQPDWIATDGITAYVVTTVDADANPQTSARFTDLRAFVDGRTLWTTRVLPTATDRSPHAPAMIHGVVYVTMDPGSVSTPSATVAINARTGVRLWRADKSKYVVQQPPVVAAGRLLLLDYGIEAYGPR